MFPNSRMFWNVRAMPARTTFSGFGGRIDPSSVTFPSVGMYMPVRQLKKVVFPAPLGPMRPTISPSCTFMLTSSTAVRPPKRIVTPLASRTIFVPTSCGVRWGSVMVTSPLEVLCLDELAEFLVVLVELDLPALAGNEALGTEPHHDDEQQAEHQQPVVVDLAQLLGEA